MASLLFPSGFRVTDANDNPLPGAKVYVFGAGGTTPQTTYQDVALSSAHAHPVVCDSGGRPPQIYLSGGANVKVRVTTSADVTVFEDDDVTTYVSNTGTVPVASGGTGATTASGARTNLGAASQTELDALSTTVSAIDSQLDSVGGSLGDVASLDAIAPTNLAAGFDAVILQRVRVVNSTKSTLSGATVPQDGTIPQSSEGELIFSQSFTPTRSDSVIRVRSVLQAEYATGIQATYMLFTSGSSDCIQLTSGYFNTAVSDNLYLEHEFASPGTSAITISTRLGGGASTAPQINAAHFGTVPSSFLLIEEIIDTPIL